MSLPKNSQQFVALEYGMQQYFNRYFAPVINEEYDTLKSKQAEEYRRLLDARPVAPGQSGMMNAGRAAQEVRRHGDWNTKTSVDLMKSSYDRIFSDENVNEDLKFMKDKLRDALKHELGVEDYDRMSKEVGADLADYYTLQRFEDYFVSHLARKGMPQSSLEYIVRKGFGDTLPAFLLSFTVPEGSDMDKRISQRSDQLYDTSSSEKAAASAVSIVSDFAATGGSGTVVKAAVTMSIDAGLRFLLSRVPENTTRTEALSDYIFSDKGVIDALHAKSGTTDLSQSDYLLTLNRSLARPIIQPKHSDKDVAVLCKSLKASIPLENTSGLVSGLAAGFKDAGITVSDKSAPPSYMSKENDVNLHHYACYFSALAMEMQAKGIRQLKLSGQVLSADQVAQKGYDYARTLASSRQRVQEQESAAREERRQLIEEERRRVSQSFATSNEPSSDRPASKDVTGWEQMLDGEGLHLFGDVGHNLGYVLSMLPEMLVGMFTGKLPNFRFRDNLLPVACIAMGMFFKKSPFLKMLFIGLGGAQLLHNAGEAVLSGSSEKSVPRRPYRSYDDEVLDSRLEGPVMKGNTLLVTIDGVPTVNTIDDDTCDAFYKGCLPLNTLSNAVLRRWDERQEAISNDLNHSLQESESVERSRGLR